MRKYIFIMIVTGLICVSPAAAKQRPNQPGPKVSGKFKPPAKPVRPLKNVGTIGNVIFTFDDGPDVYTTATIAELQKLHIPATFFVVGNKAAASPNIIRTEVSDGFKVENHTFDHKSFTGISSGTLPLTPAQQTTELTSTNTAIVNAGAPQPTEWRPPFGDISPAIETLASNLGLQTVMPFGTNIIDSRDWVTTNLNNQCAYNGEQIALNVTQGYFDTNLTFVPGIKADTIISMHDGSNCTPNTIASLQPIVDFMNAHHLGATSTMRPDATGGF